MQNDEYQFVDVMPFKTATMVANTQLFMKTAGLGIFNKNKML